MTRARDVSSRGGLTLIVPTGATNGTVGANGAVTIGSAVSSITVQGAFSAAYDNYKIVISGGTATVLDSFSLQLTGLTSNYRHQFIFGGYSSTLTGNGSIGNSNWPYVGFHSTAYLDMNVDLRNPFLAKPTIMTAIGIAGSTYSGTNTGLQADLTSTTGFTITLGAAGTITGGTIRIYGYNNGA